MLIRYTAYYGLARGVPGLLNFLAIAIYTRLLSPSDYGIYALVVVWVGLVNVVCFQWIRLSLLRFFPANLDDPRRLLSTLLLAYTSVALTTGVVGVGVLLAVNDTAVRSLVLIAVPLVWVQAGFELSLELMRSQLNPLRYGLMAGVKAVIALGLGVLLITWGFGAFGPLLAMLVGMLAAVVALGASLWRGARPSLALLPDLKPLLSYGLPLTATFALGFVVSSSDRFLLAALLNNEAVGIYTAGYDLVAHVIDLLLMTVNLAGYPLVVRALEQRGREAAREQLDRNGGLLLLIGIPVTLGFIVLAPQIVALMLGGAFHEGATQLVPWVALGVFMSCIRAFHFDLAFQLSEKTLYQVWINGGAALINVVLNLLLIPAFGLMGAAYATVIAYGVALALSVLLGRRLFAVSLVTRDNLKVLLCGAIMVACLWPLREASGTWALVEQVLLGAAVYTVSAFSMNVANVRELMFAKRRTVK
ncbi:oligosaccharide flippase family protein [Chromohalobacter canadensis]|uniref:Oligosaccharide flippase family protein n=1 Tax=Chromohalobacter canadensis TaxID=141389 RepID=A0ABZ0YBI7_9GAMM|nr:oligosaccharide flippase family protein [Chromohalobacter canadensis]MCK0769386.1 oligosaccharide flippase family protein [Chromohalobacter canadensis]WQH08959.1 oligosaccharide flippase family protein [Chromohalobacter canadensis]